MINNHAILNCFTKQLCFKFEEKFFTIDLTKGDLEDSWNTIQFSDKTSLDFNFSWEYSEDKPSATLYGLTYNAESDTYSVNTKECYPLKIVNMLGNKGDYLDMEYQPNIGIVTHRIYSGCKMLKRTTSLDIASDFSAKSTIVDKLVDVHIVAMDKYGATKVIEIDEKYNTYYNLGNSKTLNNKYNRNKYQIE